MLSGGLRQFVTVSLLHPSTQPVVCSVAAWCAAIPSFIVQHLSHSFFLYMQVPEIQRMTEEEVAAARKTEGIKVRREGHLVGFGGLKILRGVRGLSEEEVAAARNRSGRLGVL